MNNGENGGWSDFTDGVKKLDVKEKSTVKPDEKKYKIDRINSIKYESGAVAASEMPFINYGDNNFVDGNLAAKLRKGKLEIEGKLDMHGLTQELAFTNLIRFVDRAFSDGKRCVLVVTGKGNLKDGGGVLRNQLPAWLNSPQIRSKILMFTRAQPKDGGSGAVYILLKRNRDI